MNQNFSKYYQHYKIIIHTMLFTLLGVIIISHGLPTALSMPGQGPDLETDLNYGYSINLNEYLMKNNGQVPQFNSDQLNTILPRFETWGDNHLFLPVYRALKSGIHLTNLGYGEGLASKDFNPTNKYIYRSVYTSGYNNLPLLLYDFIPKSLHSITTPKEELAAASYVTKFRFILAYVHLFGLVMLFLALYKRLGVKYAWTLALVFAFNPGSLFLLGNMLYTTVINYLLIAYSVYFYPSIIENYSRKKYLIYLLGFATISIFFGLFGTAYYILIAWASTLVLMLFMETRYNISNKNYKLTCWVNSGLRVGLLVVLPILGFYIIYHIERYKMFTLYGPEIYDLWAQRVQQNFRMSTLVEYGKFIEITTLPQFMRHFHVYWMRMLDIATTLPALWMHSFMLKLLVFIPPMLLALKFKYLLIMFVTLCLYAFYHLKTKILATMIDIIVAGLYFFLWTLGINIISTMAGYHFVITAWVYSFYIAIIIALFSMKIISMLHRQYINDIKKG